MRATCFKWGSKSEDEPNPTIPGWNECLFSFRVFKLGRSHSTTPSCLGSTPSLSDNGDHEKIGSIHSLRGDHNKKGQETSCLNCGAPKYGRSSDDLAAVSVIKKWLNTMAFFFGLRSSPTFCLKRAKMQLLRWRRKSPLTALCARQLKLQHTH